jgi:hypothetical protein
VRSSEALFESGEPAEKARFPGCNARFGIGVAQTLTSGTKFRQSQLDIFDGKLEVSFPAFEMNRQLLAGFDGVPVPFEQTLPKLGCGGVISTALGHECKIARSLLAMLGGQTRFECFRAESFGPWRFAAAVQKTGKAEQIAAVGAGVFFSGEQRIDFSEERGQAAQVHLVVADDSGEGRGRTTSQIIEIKLGYQRRSDVVLATPAEALGIEDLSFEVGETYGTEAQFPEGAGWMEEIEVSGEFWCRDAARHREAAFKERPIERFAVESQKHRALCDAFCE